jgi:hypothetical protein
MAKETKRPGASAAVAPTHDWSQTQGPTGFDNVNQEDLGIPFLSILQKLSPQIDKDNAEYPTKGIEGAEVGDIINTVSNTVVCSVGEEMEFVPCTYQRLYMEWKPRTSGGGLVKTHKDANILLECQRNERNQDVLRNGNLVVTTSYFYGIALIDGARTPCVIGLSSTQLKKAKQWLNMAMSIKLKRTDDTPYTPPLFSHSYKLSTVPEKNESGTWRGWCVKIGSMVSDPVLIAEAMSYAKRATQQVQAGLNAPPKEEADTVLA